MATTSLEVADIVRADAGRFAEGHSLRAEQRQALQAIACCRTAAYGGHLYECDSCQHRHPAYNSCRNRHCPKCRTLAKERWLEHRQSELLPVGYFHIVFTIPDTLHPLFRSNLTVLYDLLFRAASRTLLEIGLDPKHLGARLGVLAILHTWSQTLTLLSPAHPLRRARRRTDCRRRWLDPVSPSLLRSGESDRSSFPGQDARRTQAPLQVSDLRRSLSVACLPAGLRSGSRTAL